ncbi:MAG: hypothetical protein HY328_01770 [Chloroflexi bacterium]|nr:hypothetical protein [Chloroflexota bacterium]
MLLSLLAYALALWLGTFLLVRDGARPAPCLAGLGLIAYGLALAGTLLAGQSSAETARLLVRFANPLFFLPAILWAGTLSHLLPEDAPWRELFVRGWNWALPFVLLIFYGLAVGTGWVFDGTGAVQPTGYLLAGLAALLPLIEVLILLGVGLLRAGPRRHVGLLLVALLFFSLSATLLVLPTAWLPRAWLLLGMGVDLLLLGIGVAALDAFQEGEAWLPGLLRSLSAAFLYALIFATPVAITGATATGFGPALVALLLVIVTLAVLAPTLDTPVQIVLDRLAYARFPRLRRVQAELRIEAQRQVRVADNPSVAALDADEFARLTRRALSHFGNLPKLATSPLTQLRAVESRLAEAGLEGSTLERAAILKSLLAESIDRLAPPGSNGVDPAALFSSTEEWRHFNALYYPYVAGLRPYSRRAAHDHLPPAEEAALEWLRVAVPERTLYNWQKDAAALVAQDLREREGVTG